MIRAALVVGVVGVIAAIFHAGFNHGRMYERKIIRAMIEEIKTEASTWDDHIYVDTVTPDSGTEWLDRMIEKANDTEATKTETKNIHVSLKSAGGERGE